MAAALQQRGQELGQVTLFAFLSSMMFDGRRDVPKDVKRA
jgi:hypothetical protein